MREREGGREGGREGERERCSHCSNCGNDGEVASYSFESGANFVGGRGRGVLAEEETAVVIGGGGVY